MTVLYESAYIDVMVDTTGIELPGCIPRVERQESHQKFLWSVRPPIAMIGLKHAARVAAYNDSFFPPETDIILTSTIADNTLASYTFEDELRIIRALNPKWVIPFDFPVYGDMEYDKRIEHATQVANGVIDMNYILGETPDEAVDEISEIKNIDPSLIKPVQDTEVIPLIKGVNSDVREKTITAGERINAPIYAKYAAQYMTVGGNGNYPELVNDLHDIQDETDNHPILLIGLQSPTGQFSLEGVPENVVAGSGMNQWLKYVEPRSRSPERMREGYAELHNTTNEVLERTGKYYTGIARGTRDSPPAELIKKPGKAIDDSLQASNAGAAGKTEYGFGQRARDEDAMSAVNAGKLGGKHSGETN